MPSRDCDLQHCTGVHVLGSAVTTAGDGLSGNKAPKEGRVVVTAERKPLPRGGRVPLECIHMAWLAHVHCC